MSVLFHKMKMSYLSPSTICFTELTCPTNGVKLRDFFGIYSSCNILPFFRFYRKKLQQIIMIKLRNVLQFGRISKSVLGASHKSRLHYLHYLPAVLSNAKQNYPHSFMGISIQLARFSTSVNPVPISVYSVQ